MPRGYARSALSGCLRAARLLLATRTRGGLAVVRWHPSIDVADRCRDAGASGTGADARQLPQRATVSEWSTCRGGRYRGRHRPPHTRYPGSLVSSLLNKSFTGRLSKKTSKRYSTDNADFRAVVNWSPSPLRPWPEAVTLTLPMLASQRVSAPPKASKARSSLVAKAVVPAGSRVPFITETSSRDRKCGQGGKTRPPKSAAPRNLESRVLLAEFSGERRTIGAVIDRNIRWATSGGRFAQVQPSARDRMLMWC